MDTPGILAILHRDGSDANVGLVQPELYLSDMEYRTGMGTIPAEPVICEIQRTATENEILWNDAAMGALPAQCSLYHHGPDPSPAQGTYTHVV